MSFSSQFSPWVMDAAFPLLEDYFTHRAASQRKL
jgi:hypothetical protein